MKLPGGHFAVWIIGAVMLILFSSGELGTLAQRRSRPGMMMPQNMMRGRG